jgi:hypothetical protein
LTDFKTECKDRAVAVVYDNSASMKGEQIRIINYSLQMLISMLDENDELAVFTQCPGLSSSIPGDDINNIDLLNKQEAINRIQSEQRWNTTYSGLHTISVSNAVRFIQNSRKSVKWLILLTDGEPETGNDIKKMNLEQLESSNVMIIYINTDKQQYFDSARGITYNKGNTLLPFIRDHNKSAVIYQTDQNSNRLLSIMSTLSKDIIGADESIDKPVLKNDKLIIDSPVALNCLIVVEQSGNGISNCIKNARLNSQSLSINKALISKDQLTAVVYRITGSDSSAGVLEPGMYELDIETPESLSDKNILIFPDPFVEFSIKVNNIPPENSRFISCSCLETDDLAIELFTKNKEGSIIPVSSEKLNNIACSVSMNGNISSSAALSNEAYRMTLRRDSACGFSVNAVCKGFFNVRSKNYSIIKQACRKVDLVYPKKVRFQKLEDGLLVKNKVVVIDVIPALNGSSASAQDFKELSLKVTNTPDLVKVKIDTLENLWKVTIIPAWGCSCLLTSFSDSIIFNVSSSSLCIERPADFALGIELQEQSRFLRCAGLLKIVVILLLIVIFLFGIITKRRFGRSAEVYYQKSENIPFQYSSKEEPWKKTFLSKSGFIHLIVRVFIPFIPERRKISIYRDTLLFVAGKNKSHIILPLRYQKKNMKYSGVPLEKREDLFLEANNELTITHDESLTRLKYIPNTKGSGL